MIIASRAGHVALALCAALLACLPFVAFIEERRVVREVEPLTRVEPRPVHQITLRSREPMRLRLRARRRPTPSPT